MEPNDSDEAFIRRYHFSPDIVVTPDLLSELA